MLRIFFALFVAGCLSSAAFAQQNGFVHEEGSHIDFLRNGKPLVRLMYAFDDSTKEKRHETYKVYHHVFDAAGENVITKGPGGQFTHHRGIFIGWSKLAHKGKRFDLWHMRDCTIEHQRFVKQEADDESSTVTSVNHWLNPEGEIVLEETRTLTVHDDDSAHLLADFVTELKAVNGEVLLDGDPEHAGVQYRPHDEVSKNKSATYTFHADGIDAHKARDLPWVALTYKLGDKVYTVQHMRHADNPSDSLYSAYRNYGRFGNFFVTKIADGDTLTLRYRFRITPGEAPNRDELAKQYEKW